MINENAQRNLGEFVLPVNDLSADHDQQTMAILRDIAESLNEANDVSEAMAVILPKLSDILGLSTAWAFRYDPKRSVFVEVGASGLPPALAQGDACALKNGWCECQDQFHRGALHKAVNIVRCSRMNKTTGDKGGLVYHASIPLRSKGQPFGILNVAASGHAIFTEQALTLLGAIGAQVAVAMDRAGLFADERKRTAQLRALSDVSKQLISMIDPARIMQEAVERFVDILAYQACGITVQTTDQGTDSHKELIAVAHAPTAVASDEYHYSDDVSDILLPESERLVLANAQSSLCVQIPHTDYELRVESDNRNAFSELDEDLLLVFAGHFSAVLENAKLYQQSLQDAKWLERRKLAADLHDAVSQRLFSATLLIKSTGVLLERQSERTDLTTVKSIVERIQDLISQSQNEMRSLIEALRPSDERGLVFSMRERLAPLQLQSAMRIHFHADTHPALPAYQREALLCVVDEATHNALRHGKAKNIYITVSFLECCLTVTIRDDGTGFASNHVSLGLGTTTMYDRMAAIGGRLHIRSQIGHGTTVMAELLLTGDANE